MLWCLNSLIAFKTIAVFNEFRQSKIFNMGHLSVIGHKIKLLIRKNFNILNITLNGESEIMRFVSGVADCIMESPDRECSR